jgi:hypothetical protein
VGSFGPSARALTKLTYRRMAVTLTETAMLFTGLPEMMRGPEAILHSVAMEPIASASTQAEHVRIMAACSAGTKLLLRDTL